MVYSIDLATLLQLLQEFRKNGTLQADLPKNAGGFKGQCQAHLELVEGNVVSCHIKNVRGQYMVSGENALQLLYSLGALDWVLNAAPASNSFASSSITPLGEVKANNQPDFNEISPALSNSFPLSEFSPGWNPRPFGLPEHSPNLNDRLFGINEVSPNLPGKLFHVHETSPNLQSLLNQRMPDGQSTSGPLKNTSSRFPDMRDVFPMSLSPIPRKLIHVSQEDLNLWPRKHRRVFVLIDGERSVEKITSILSPLRGVTEVMEVLRDLRARGLIAMDE